MKLLLITLMLIISGLSFGASRIDSSKPSQMDDLIRGEMAAVKSYDMVLTKVKDEQELTKLKAIREDHVNAVTKLKSMAMNKDIKEDTKTAGPWGTFAEAWTGGAKLFGNAVALKALTQGEEHGVAEYKEALNDNNVTPEIKKMIKTHFLPKQEEHLKTIKSFM